MTKILENNGSGFHVSAAVLNSSALSQTDSWSTSTQEALVTIIQACSLEKFSGPAALLSGLVGRFMIRGKT